MDPELQILNSNGKSNKPDIAIICKDLNRPKKTKPLGERSKAVWRQQIMVFLGNTGVLGGGMAVALPSVTLSNLCDNTKEFHLDSDEASWFSSINTMACPLGGLLVGYLMDRIGRKRTILVTNLFGVLGWALLAAAPLHHDRTAVYIQMLIGRFISGIMIGLCVSPVGVYSAEISLPTIRGRLILGTSIGIASGILFMYLLGYFIRSDWQLIAIISCVYQIIATLCVLPMPETPSWLLQKGRSEHARKSLKYFRGLKRNDIAYCEEFEVEFAQIKRTADNSRDTAAGESFLQTCRAPEVYKPLLLMIGFFAFQQLSGVVVVVVFAVQIAVRAGVDSDPVLVAVFVGVARIITTFFMGSLFEKWGRKPAGIVSAAGMAICMLSLALGGWWSPLNEFLPYLPMACIVLYIIFSTMGLLTLPFFMISEVFPQRVRGFASGLSVCFGLLISFIVIKVYPSMEQNMGMPGVFAFYGLVALTAVFYIWLLIPETRGRTLLEIEEYFRGNDRRLSSRSNELTLHGLGPTTMATIKITSLTVTPNETDVEMKEMFIQK